MATESGNWFIVVVIALLIVFAAYGTTHIQVQQPINVPVQKIIPPALVELEVQQISIGTDSSGFYLDGGKITTLEVNPNSFVTLSIHVLPNTGYYGLIFKSSRFSDLKINAGETGVVEFDGVGDFTITSYKPATTTTNVESEIAVLRVVAQ